MFTPDKRLEAVLLSIIRFMENRNSDIDRALSSLSSTLLRSIAREAIRADPTACLEFQDCILALEQRLQRSKEASDVYVVSGVADKAIQDYNQSVKKHFSEQAGELQMVAANALRTIGEIHKSGVTGLECLKQLEEKLLKASDAHSLHECRIQIGQCLLSIREEVQRQKLTSGQTISRINSQLNNCTDQTIAQRRTGDDPVSGLAARHQAEEALDQLLHMSNLNSFVVLFVVHRVELINTKYGYAAGDQIIRSFLRHLMQTFSIVDDLFRWSGPAFLAITNRPGELVSLQADVMKVTSHRIEENIVVGNREVLLPIASSALTLQLFKEPDMGGLIQKLDGFTKSHY